MGLILSCNLSWSSHTNSTIKRAKRLICLIYCQFYSLSFSKTLLFLYSTFFVLEYGSSICDLSSVSLSSSEESVQYFALKMILKSWSAPYDILLSSLRWHSLEHRWQRSKILFFFKINNGLLHSALPWLNTLPFHQCHSDTSAPLTTLPHSAKQLPISILFFCQW